MSIAKMQTNDFKCTPTNTHTYLLICSVCYGVILCTPNGDRQDLIAAL